MKIVFLTLSCLLKLILIIPDSYCKQLELIILNDKEKVAIEFVCKFQCFSLMYIFVCNFLSVHTRYSIN